MRVCIKHMAKAVMTLTDKMEGTEYDLCQKCKDEFVSLMLEEFIPNEETEIERKRTPGRPKAAKR